MHAATPTQSDGSFVLGSLPDGEYLVCPVPSDERFVNACEWDKPTHVFVKSGSVASLPTFHFKQGTAITIHLSDPKALLKVRAT
jgi:hypothetical protein